MNNFWLETTNANDQYIWEEFAPKKLVLRAYKSPDSDWITTDAGFHKNIGFEQSVYDAKKYAAKLEQITNDEVFVNLL
jgi:hypothetical protein